MEPRAAQPHRYESPPGERQERQPFHHAQSSVGAVGAIGHVLKLGTILAPLIIGELVKDPDKRWRYIRIASVVGAVGFEGLHAQKVSRERRECEQRDYQR